MAQLASGNATSLTPLHAEPTTLRAAGLHALSHDLGVGYKPAARFHPDADEFESSICDDATPTS